MADKKISALDAGDPAEAGDEVPVNRGGANFKVTAGSIASLATATDQDARVLAFMALLGFGEVR